MILAIAAIAYALCGSPLLYGQTQIDTANAPRVILPLADPKTPQFADTLHKLSIRDNPNIKITGGLKMTKNPTEAIWKSLVLPGWGQYYVESYWKAPIFTAATGVLVYFIIDNHNKYANYRDKINAGDYANDLEKSLLRRKRDYYLDNRDISGLYLLGVYLLASVDAYVGAHLYDFTVDESLSLGIYTRNESAGLAFRLKF